MTNYQYTNDFQLSEINKYEESMIILNYSRQNH